MSVGVEYGKVGRTGQSTLDQSTSYILVCRDSMQSDIRRCNFATCNSVYISTTLEVCWSSTIKAVFFVGGSRSELAAEQPQTSVNGWKVAFGLFPLNIKIKINNVGKRRPQSVSHSTTRLREAFHFKKKSVNEGIGINKNLIEAINIIDVDRCGLGSLRCGC
ncbi:hypothetical protein CDAR_466081 [Caerostris darwini]|uniref:Ribosomal protein S11 n=1 Tax=Caerostris darwini TaxID=1538125 RepID=A0AAV4WQF4_9ARAC|nr:hypothetical protein CDAR_466081 [Caerostris darwini]